MAAFLITEKSHPGVYRALDLLSYDTGFPHREAYPIPSAWTGDLREAEPLLGGLSEDDLETFVIGDQDEADAMVARDPMLASARDLLSMFFDETI